MILCNIFGKVLGGGGWKWGGGGGGGGQHLAVHCLLKLTVVLAETCAFIYCLWELGSGEKRNTVYMWFNPFPVLFVFVCLFGFSLDQNVESK